MINIMCFTFKRMFKNVPFLFGATVMILLMIFFCRPYLKYLPLTSQQDIIDLVKKTGDEMDVHIPVNDVNERIKIAIESLKANLKESGMDDKKIDEIVYKIGSSNMSIEEIGIYLQVEFNIYGFIDIYNNTKSKLAYFNETKQYIDNQLKKEAYSAYFSRRFADLLGTICILYILMVFPFLFESDFKNGMLDLLHSKTIAPVKYVLGKTLGALLSVLTVIIITTGIFSIWLQIKGGISTIPVNFFDIWKYTAWWILPSIFYAAFLLVFLSIFFRTGIAPIPVYIIYFLWSSMPSRLSDGSVYLPVNPFFIYVRYQDLFFKDIDQIRISAISVNRMIIISLMFVLIFLSLKAWQGRVRIK